MIGQGYDQILTQLAKNYKFVIRDDGLGIQLKMKAVDIILLVDWLDKRIPSQDLNLLNR